MEGFSVARGIDVGLNRRHPAFHSQGSDLMGLPGHWHLVLLLPLDSWCCQAGSLGCLADTWTFALGVTSMGTLLWGKFVGELGSAGKCAQGPAEWSVSVEGGEGPPMYPFPHGP